MVAAPRRKRPHGVWIRQWSKISLACYSVVTDWVQIISATLRSSSGRIGWMRCHKVLRSLWMASQSFLCRCQESACPARQPAAPGMGQRRRWSSRRSSAIQTLVAVSLELKQDGDSTCRKSPCRSQTCRQDQQLLFIATHSRPQLQGTERRGAPRAARWLL